MLEAVIGLALWFAFALASAFAVQAYGWLGFLGIAAFVELCRACYRVKAGRWLP